MVELNAKDRDGLVERIQIANLPDGDKEILTGLIEFNNWVNDYLGYITGMTRCI